MKTPQASSATLSLLVALFAADPALGCPMSQRLFFKADDSIIAAVAAVNPEAAKAMYILTRTSATVEHPTPMVGDMYASTLATEASVLESIRSGSSDQSVARLTRPIKDPDMYSRSDWRVTKGKDSAVLALTHGLYDGASRKQTLYPNIQVNLKWVEVRQSGYWAADSWDVQE